MDDSDTAAAYCSDEHACARPEEVVDPNRATWLLGHTHALQEHEVYWTSMRKKLSPSEMLRLMAGQPPTDAPGNAASERDDHHVWTCRLGRSATAAHTHGVHRHAMCPEQMWIAETWSHVVQMLHVQGVVKSGDLARHPVDYTPCPHWDCQREGFSAITSATMSVAEDTTTTTTITAESLVKIQNKAVFGALFGQTAVVFVSAGRSSSTPIDAVRPLVEFVTSIGANSVHLVMRSAMIAKSIKTLRGEFPDVAIVFWTEDAQSFDWFNNAVCSPLAVVSGEDREKVDATLGYLKESVSHLSPLASGPISDRFNMKKGDILHSQRSVPKLTRNLRRFDG